MNEIILYSKLDRQSAEDIVRQLSWIGENQVYAMRLYCPGGDVEGSWGIIAKMQELKLKGCHSIGKVDGMAASMGGVLLCFFDEREALDVSNIMLHRAAMSQEKDENGNPIPLTKEDKQYLAKINNDLKSKLVQVIDDAQLRRIKGVSIDDLFDEKKERINCWLNAYEAQQIGLITKVVTLDASTSQYMAKAVAACYNPTTKPEATAATAGTNVKQNATKMTAEEFKKENPEAYEAIRKEGAAEAEKAHKAEGGAGASSGPKDPVPTTAEMIAAGVEAALKKMGIAGIEGSQQGQTAQATAAQAAKAEADKKAKAEADTKKAVEDLASDIEKIKSGK